MYFKISDWFAHLWRQDEPDYHASRKYHPQYGFEGREEIRERIAPTVTEKEMNDFGLERRSRDSCAYYTLWFRACLEANTFAWYRCKGISDERNHCLFESRVDEMKEFEREKRLNRRERLLKEKEMRQS